MSSRSSSSSERRSQRAPREDVYVRVEQRSMLALERPAPVPEVPVRRPSYYRDNSLVGQPARPALSGLELGSSSRRLKAGERWQSEAHSPTRMHARASSDSQIPSPTLANKPLAASNSRRPPQSPTQSPSSPASIVLPIVAGSFGATPPVTPARASSPVSPARGAPPTVPPKSPRRSQKGFNFAVTEPSPVDEPSSPTQEQGYATAPNTITKHKRDRSLPSLPTPLQFEPFEHLKLSSSPELFPVDASSSNVPYEELGPGVTSTPRSPPRDLPTWTSDQTPRAISTEEASGVRRRARSAHPTVEGSPLLGDPQTRFLSAAQLLDVEAEELSEDTPLSDTGSEGRSPSPLRRNKRVSSQSSYKTPSQRRALRSDSGHSLEPASPPPDFSPNRSPGPPPPPPRNGTSSPSINRRGSSLLVSHGDDRGETSPPPSSDLLESIASSSITGSSLYGTPETTPPLRPRASHDLLEPPSSESLAAAVSAGVKKRRHRMRAIQELISTEWTYAQDLAIARDVYYARAQGAPLSEIAGHLEASGDFVPPPTPMMQAHQGFVPLSPDLSRRSFAPSPALQSTPSFASTPSFTPSASTSSLAPPSPRPQQPALSAADVRIVFLNLEELASFGAAFSGVLDDAAGSAMQDEDNATDDRIGEEFLRMIPRIASLYTAYCSRHGAALHRLEELEPSLTAYLTECQDLCKTLTHSWSLGSLLIKPVQRCLKYPLLIETILSSTPTSHPDYPNLERALEQMLVVAQELNEAKRRTELVDRAVKKKEKPRKSSGLASVSFGQTVGKKFLRTGYRAQKATGLEAPVIEDTEETALLDTLIAQFEARAVDLEALNIYTRSWLTAWVVSLQKNRLLLNAWMVAYEPIEGETEIQGGTRDMLRAYIKLVQSIEDELLSELSRRLHRRVFPTLTRLEALFQGPRAVLAKRAAKRVDFERAAQRPNDRIAAEGRTAYLGYSAALLEELPVFLNGISRAVDVLVAELARTQASFYRAKHARYVAFERAHCSKFAGADELISAWWTLVQPMHAAIDGLSCTRSELLMRRAEGQRASSSKWRRSNTSNSTDTSGPSRAHSLPGVSVESLPLREEGSKHQRSSTGESRASISDTRSSTGSNRIGIWLRKSNRSSAPSPPTTPDELASIRRFFANAGSTSGNSSPATSPTMIVHQRNSSVISLPQEMMHVQYFARAQRNSPAGFAQDGRSLLATSAGERIGVLWEEGDSDWVLARNEMTGLQGFIDRGALTSLLPAGAGVGAAS